MNGQGDQPRSKWDYSWFCSLSGLLPTSVALHVLGVYTRDCWLSIIGLLNTSRLILPRFSMLQNCAGAKPKAGAARPSRALCLALYWFLPELKTLKKIKPITSPIASKRLILPKILQKASVNPRRDNLLFFFFLDRWDFLVSNCEEQDKKNSLKDLARQSKLNA